MIQSKEKDVVKQAEGLFCLKELIVSSTPRSEPETAKKPFFLKIHSKRLLLIVEETTNLILVDTELTLS